MTTAIESPILQDLSHLTEPELREALISTRSAIDRIDRHLSSLNHTQTIQIPPKPTFCIRSDTELGKMSETDLLQEIANVSSLLSLDPSLSTAQSDKYLEEAHTSLSQLTLLHKRALWYHGDAQQYCACRLAHHPDRSMVECEICKDWFHLTCINLSAELMHTVAVFNCPSCSGESSLFEIVNGRVNRVDSNYETKADVGHWRVPEPEQMSEQQLLNSIHRSQKAFADTEEEIRRRLVEEAVTPSMTVDGDTLASDMAVRSIRREGKEVIRIPWIFIQDQLKPTRRRRKRRSNVSERQKQMRKKSRIESVYQSSITDCSVCRGKQGLVICCDGCPRMYHPECLIPQISDPDSLPAVWNCHVCK